MSLEWRQVHSGYDGYAGKVRLFTIRWGLIRESEKPWVLRCELPGYTGKQWEFAKPAKAEEVAAALWRRWQIVVGIQEET